MADGNLIVMEYLITNGMDANNIGNRDVSGSRSFTSGAISGLADIVVATTSNGGSSRETIASIKSNAPKAYQSQDRNVTANDYKNYIETNYTNADDVYVWGGEDNNPPEYGKVFVSVKPTNASFLNNEEKISLQNLIKAQNIVSIIPDVVDPIYLYLKITSSVSFDADEATISAKDLSALVEAKILTYKNTTLEKFARNLRYSKFIKQIDDTDDSILGNETSIVMQRRITPTLNQTKTYTIKFENSIEHPHSDHMSTVSSSQFEYAKSDGTTCTAYIEDINGVLKIYEFVGETKNYVNADIGSVNYENGTVVLKDFSPVTVKNNILKIDCVPTNKDILSERGTILVIDTADPDSLVITAEAYNPYSTSISSSSVSTSEATNTSDSGSSSSSSSGSSSSGY